MGSPITFSGFNSIDFGVVLNAIMQQERAPIAAIERQRSTLQARNSAFATFATKLAALERAVADLAGVEGVNQIRAASSDESAVGISTASASVTGRYEVTVSELARAQVLASTSTYDSLDAVVASVGTISLARFGQPPVDVVIAGAMTLEQLAEAINSHPDSPVNASVVQVTPGTYRLVFTGRATGTSNAFTVSFSTPLSGGQGLTFTDTDGDGVFGDSDADNAQVAADAQLTVNQVSITSASNTVENAIPGVTLNLLKKDPDAVVTIDVTKDQEATVSRLEAFASAYNDILKFIDEQRTASTEGPNGIGYDPLVRGLRDALRSTMMAAESSGTFTRLAEVGIGFDTLGRITIDKSRLTEALDEAPLEVARLFAGDGASGGRFVALEDLISTYTQAGGLVADVRQRIGTQVSQLAARISVLEEQLALRRAALQAEFIAADRAMSQLNSQSSSLMQLAGQFRLF